MRTYEHLQLLTHWNALSELSLTEYYFFAHANVYYWMAERARAHADSWRDFKVGSIVLVSMVAEPTSLADLQWFPGANSKPFEDGRNVCAEPFSVGPTSHLPSGAWIMGMIVVGNTQPDEHGTTTPTLRPCAHCRRYLGHHARMRPETFIITALPPHDTAANLIAVPHEVWTLKVLLDHYATQSP